MRLESKFGIAITITIVTVMVSMTFYESTSQPEITVLEPKKHVITNDDFIPIMTERGRDLKSNLIREVGFTLTIMIWMLIL